MEIFISWSKDKGKLLALETKKFILNTLGNKIEVFFSPDMYKGTSVDHEIHTNLLKSDKCIICITSDNFKNPWLMYEAGVVYGALGQMLPETDKRLQDGRDYPTLTERVMKVTGCADRSAVSDMAILPTCRRSSSAAGRP